MHVKATIDAILGKDAPPRREVQKNRFGVMVFDHKTAGTCQVLTGEQYGHAKKYDVGRHTYGSNLRRFLR